MNSEDISRPVRNLYTVAFGQKRVLRPESLKFVIGRSRCSDFVIASRKVPRKQCEIICAGSNWMIHNLSPEGTAIVGQTVVQGDDTVKFETESVLRIGGVYLLFNTQIDTAKYPVRLLKIDALIGEKYCKLVEDSELQPDELIRKVVPERKGNSNLEIPTVSSQNEELARAKVSIDKLISDNQLVVQQLKEARTALKEALDVKGEVQLKAAEKEKQLRLSFESVEAEIQCIICNEILIDAVTLGCSHTFCDHCLQQWKRKNMICPLCRGAIHQECQARLVDSIIDTIIGNFPDDAEKRREELTNSRRAIKRQSISHQDKRRRTEMLELDDPLHELMQLPFNIPNVVNETINISSDDDDY